MKQRILISVILAMTLLLSGCIINEPGISNITNYPIKNWGIDSIHFSYNWISLTDVDFIDSKTGYILGSNGYLLKTTDSIQSWKISNIDSTGVMTSSMSFINASTGYIYGTWNILNGDFYGILFKTIDGGNHWTKQIYPTAYHLLSMKFFDETHGIALNWTNSGSYIVTTDNGGISWETSAVELDPSVNHLFYLGAICYANGKNQTILKSVDRGKTWSIIKTPPSSMNSIDGFYFLNENLGFLNLREKKYKTSNGGNNWIEISQSFPGFRTPYSPNEDFHFCSSAEGIMIRDSIAYTGGDFPSFIGSTVYTTTDGGNKWIKSDFLKHFWFGSIDFVTNDFAYCISNNYIYKLQKK